MLSDALGRSRGGLSTKLHLACEQGQRLLAVVLTAGQRGDAPQFPAVMAAIRVPRLGPGRPRTRPETVRADKAYSSRAIRRHLRSRKIRCTIPAQMAVGHQDGRQSIPTATGVCGCCGGRLITRRSLESSRHDPRSPSAHSTYL
ncbi:transposase [Nonomuraea sp. NPDC049421]|uniref:transposase n=1 Tax=Nonomuraea sp. NPDC049421 TaxID=3155275 RepID=UPI00342F96C1